MTRVRRLLILPLAGVAALAAATLAWQLRAPSWLLPRVSAEIEASTHLRLDSDSLPEASLLPSPAIRLSKVRLVPAEDGAAPLLTADALEVTFAWKRLLRFEAEIERLHLVAAHLLTPELHSPLDIVAEAHAATAEIVITGPATRVRVVAHPETGTLALDDVVVQSGRLRLSGTGRLLPRDPLRLVLNSQFAFGESRLGTLAMALSYSSDGVVLERAEWRRVDGGEVELFGHAAVAGEGLRFEGGLAASVGAPTSLDASARFDGAAGPQGVRVAVDDVDMRAGGSRLTGRGTYAGGAAAHLAVELRMDRLDVAAVTGLIRTPTDSVSALLVDAVAASDGELRLRLGELVQNGATIGDGIVLDLARQDGVFDLRELAARSVGGAPLHATGRFSAGSPATLAADPLDVTYGSVNARGRGQIDLGGVRPHLELDIATGPLALDTLVAGPPPLPPEPMTRRAAAASMAAARHAPPVAGWSRAPLPLPQSFPLDADVIVATPRIAWGGHRIDDARVSLQLGERQVLLRKLTGSLYGGQLDASGLYEPRTRPHFAGRAQLNGADFSNLLGALADTRNISGRGNIGADVQADGNSIADLIGSLTGTVDVTARDGATAGIDVAAAAERLKRSARPTDLIEVGRLITTGQTPFATLSGHFQLERGIARTDSLAVTASRAAARTHGSVDLANWTLNLTNEFQLNDPPDVPPFAIKLDGSIASPRRVFDINRLQSYLLRRAGPSVAR